MLITSLRMQVHPTKSHKSHRKFYHRFRVKLSRLISRICRWLPKSGKGRHMLISVQEDPIWAPGTEISKKQFRGAQKIRATSCLADSRCSCFSSLSAHIVNVNEDAATSTTTKDSQGTFPTWALDGSLFVSGFSFFGFRASDRQYNVVGGTWPRRTSISASIFGAELHNWKIKSFRVSCSINHQITEVFFRINRGWKSSMCFVFTFPCVTPQEAKECCAVNFYYLWLDWCGIVCGARNKQKIRKLNHICDWSGVGREKGCEDTWTESARTMND